MTTVMLDWLAIIFKAEREKKVEKEKVDLIDDIKFIFVPAGR
jgi:hypothetical protein